MNKRDDTDKPPVLSEARLSASLLEDSALLKSVTPPTPPPVLQAAAEPAKPAGGSFGSAVMMLVRDAHFHPPIIVLSVAIGSLAFLSGFLTYRLAYRVATPDVIVSTASHSDNSCSGDERLTFTGRLAWYDTTTQKLKNDSDAVVILLPDDQTPRMLLQARGARPADRNTTQQEEFSTQINELGGGFATTNSDGVFTLTLGQGGSYTLLALSSCLRDTTDPIPASVTANLKRYFASPDEGLIGTARYHYIRPFVIPAETQTVPASLLHIF